MRLLIISNYFYPEIGAAPNRIYNLSKALVKDHTVEILAPLPNYPHGKIVPKYKGKLYNIEKFEGMKIFRYFIYPSKSRNVVLRILSMLSFSICLWASLFHIKKIKNIDAVIIQNSPLLVSFSGILLFKKIFKRKVVLNVSDLWPDSALDLGYVKEGRFYSMLKKIEAFNYKNSTAIAGQSNEILQHIKDMGFKQPTFLYRNLQPTTPNSKIQKHKEFSIVYAGLLGVAQGVFEILKHVNFDAIGVKFHIYGDGAEKEDIVAYIKSNNIKNVSYKGMVTKKELTSILPKYHFALVPLTTHIKGAVPSKIFELALSCVPIVFMGSGEPSVLIKENGLGYTVAPKAYTALNDLLKRVSEMENLEYNKLLNNCETASIKQFNFENQIKDFNTFLEKKI